MFWGSFSRNARFNAHTKETIEITITSIKYVIGKLENNEVDMKLFSREGK